MAEMVNLTIDGHEVSVPKGTTILEAAKTIGEEVPHYCYHPGLSSPAISRISLSTLFSMVLRSNKAAEFGRFPCDAPCHTVAI